MAREVSFSIGASITGGPTNTNLELDVCCIHFGVRMFGVLRFVI